MSSHNILKKVQDMPDDVADDEDIEKMKLRLQMVLGRHSRW